MAVPPGRPMGRRRCLQVLAAAAPVLMTGCAAARAPDGTDPRGSRERTTEIPAWLLARPALAQVVRNHTVFGGLAQTRVYELLQPGQQPQSLAGALPAVTFASSAQLVTAVQAGALPAQTQAVLYDPEAWSFTPVSEQRDPVSAAARAAAAARAHGLQFIVAPALNLTAVLAPGQAAAARSRSFLGLGLAAAMAQHADVIEIQAQSLERDPAGDAAFVAAAAEQARAASPHVGVLAGVSTNPPGGLVTSAQLVAAIRASQHLVDGFWLNIPGRGERCPTCNPIRPDIGIAALEVVL